VCSFRCFGTLSKPNPSIEPFVSTVMGIRFVVARIHPLAVIVTSPSSTSANCEGAARTRRGVTRAFGLEGHAGPLEQVQAPGDRPEVGSNGPALSVLPYKLVKRSQTGEGSTAPSKLARKRSFKSHAEFHQASCTPELAVGEGVIGLRSRAYDVDNSPFMSVGRLIL
jgi:hypothetical protein